jgi:hypothetical protein
MVKEEEDACVIVRVNSRNKRRKIEDTVIKLEGCGVEGDLTKSCQDLPNQPSIIELQDPMEAVEEMRLACMQR